MTIHHDGAHSAYWKTVGLAENANLPGPRIKLAQSTRISADPQGAIGIRGQRAHHLQALHWQVLPDEPPVFLLGIIQAELRAHPHAAAAIPGDGPHGFTAQTFVGGPTLPLAVAQPAGQTRP